MILIMFEGFDSDIDALTDKDLSSYHLSCYSRVVRGIIDCNYIYFDCTYFGDEDDKDPVKLKLRGNNGQV